MSDVEAGNMLACAQVGEAFHTCTFLGFIQLCAHLSKPAQPLHSHSGSMQQLRGSLSITALNTNC